MNPASAVMAAFFVVVGLLLIWVGRRGADGKLDFSLGGHSKADTDPADWELAHIIIGDGLVASGAMILFAAVVTLLGPLVGLGEEQAGGFGVGILLVACVYLVIVIVRGLGSIEKNA